MGIPAAAAAATVASSAMSMANSGGGGGSPQYGGMSGSSPYIYQPTGQGWADQTIFQGGLNGMNALIPAYSAYTSQLGVNNPYANQAMIGAQTGAAYGDTTAASAMDWAHTLQGLGTQVAPYGASILNTAFDPQQALYDRNVNLLQQQLTATNAASGVYGPQAAANNADALGNFNLNWQDRLLGRQVQGLQGYGSVVNSAGRGFSGAYDLGSGASGLAASSAGLPYGVYQGQLGSQIQGLGTLSGAYQAPMTNALNYMGYGSDAARLGLSGQDQAFRQNQIYQSQLGSGLAGLGDSLSTLFGQQQVQPGYSKADAYSQATPAAGGDMSAWYSP